MYTLSSANKILEIRVIGKGDKPGCVMVEARLTEEQQEKNLWGQIAFELHERNIFETYGEAKRVAFKSKLGMAT